MRHRKHPFAPRAMAAYERGPRAAGGVSMQGGALLLYGPIGAYWGDDGVEAAAVVAALAAAPAGPLTVRINSPGGDVFEGLAIRNALMHHAGGVATVVDGIAASAASYIATAAPVVRMHPMSMLMIHRSATVAIGNDSDMLAAAGLLETIDRQMVADYAAKSGRPPEEVKAALDAETYFTAEEALAFGLCNEIIEDAPRNPPPEQDPATAEWRLRLQARLRVAARGPV